MQGKKGMEGTDCLCLILVEGVWVVLCVGHRVGDR